MTKKQKYLLGLLLFSCLLAIVVGFSVAYQWQRFKQKQGITELAWSGLGLSVDGLRLQRLAGVQEDTDGRRMTFNAENISLEIRHLFAPMPVRSLRIDHFELGWQPADKAPEPAPPSRLPSWQQLQRWATWLPLEVDIPSLTLSLPCPAGQCSEHAALHWQRGEAELFPASLALQLQRNDHRLALEATAQRLAARTDLQVQVQLDGQQRLALRNRFENDGQGLRWIGSLAMGSLPEAPWLLDWLARWVPYDPVRLPATPETMRLGAGWAIRLPENDRLVLDWRALAGDIRASLHLPAPWPIIGLGQVQGRLDLAASGRDGLWLPTEIAGDLSVQPEPDRLAALPSGLRPASIRLRIDPGSMADETDRLPLHIQLSSEGDLAGEFETQLQLLTTAPFSADIAQARLRLKSAALALSGLALKGLEADLRLSGQASGHSAALQFDKGSRVTLAALSMAGDPSFSASRLQAAFDKVRLDAEFTRQAPLGIRLQGTASLQAGQLHQSLLRPLGWHWNGQIDANSERLALDGPLHNDAGLGLATKLTVPWNGALAFEARLQELFFRAGNPLAATLSDWPALLEVNNGRLKAQAIYNLPPGGMPATADLKLEAKGLAGIYDRIELTGLDANLTATLRRNALQLNVDTLTLAQANPGFIFGPIAFQGQYRANGDRLGAGTLSWRKAQAQVLGGRVWLDPGQWPLAVARHRQAVHIQGLRIPELFTAYPAEGLQGSGIVDGTFDLLSGPQGYSVEQGNLAARAPGGILQLRSPRIQALSRSNQAMRLVAEALDDFHYDVLTSDVRYDERGKLQLGLRLQGRNPALEGGRAINFTINLEEDIPALLTSLQLTDRVSETIQQRVQQRLKRNPAPAVP